METFTSLIVCVCVGGGGGGGGRGGATLKGNNILPILSLKTAEWVANRADPNQVFPSIRSDFGLHSLLQATCPNTWDTTRDWANEPQCKMNHDTTLSKWATTWYWTNESLCEIEQMSHYVRLNKWATMWDWTKGPLCEIEQISHYVRLNKLATMWDWTN